MTAMLFLHPVRKGMVDHCKQLPLKKQNSNILQNTATQITHEHDICSESDFQ